jgi:hypothetical protein
MIAADSCLWWEIGCETLIKGGLVVVMGLLLFWGRSAARRGVRAPWLLGVASYSSAG